MADFINYKGFKIEPCKAGFSVWGKSPFYPIDTLYTTTKSLNKCKEYIRNWLKAWKIKKWSTLYPDRITKDTITYPCHSD